jgi:hypothetical protein
MSDISGIYNNLNSGERRSVLVHVVRVHIDDLLQNVELGSGTTEAVLAPQIDDSRGSTHADPHKSMVEEVPSSVITGRAEN